MGGRFLACPVPRAAYLFAACAQYIGVSQTPADDVRLLAGARRGEEPAFLALYQRHRAPVFRFAWRFISSVHTAEDVTQECFLALFAGAAFDPKQGSLRTYLFGIARRLAMRRARIEERESEEPADAAMLQNLLADRFKLALHKESREMQIYALMVAKNGPKLKKSTPNPPPDANDAADGAPIGGAGNLAADGYPAVRSGMTIMSTPTGPRARLANNEHTEWLAGMLSGQLGRP
jgi:RNA polymerase sigma factor (sigma-70 family)